MIGLSYTNISINMKRLIKFKTRFDGGAYSNLITTRIYAKIYYKNKYLL